MSNPSGNISSTKKIMEKEKSWFYFFLEDSFWLPSVRIRWVYVLSWTRPWYRTLVYTPLIDMTPSYTATMFTAMVEARRLTARTGQNYTILAADQQQSYHVIVNVVQAETELFLNFIPRLIGMHMLISFVGCVGSLMFNRGLEEVNCERNPQNVRALRVVVDELLRTYFENLCSHDDLVQLLEDMA